MLVTKFSGLIGTILSCQILEKTCFPGDIPGKCSNFNYGSRTTIKRLRADPAYGLDRDDMEFFITTGDCDTVFGDRYFDALEEDYWKLDQKVILYVFKKKIVLF